jgi:hypothetical protein
MVFPGKNMIGVCRLKSEIVMLLDLGELRAILNKTRPVTVGDEHISSLITNQDSGVDSWGEVDNTLNVS